MPTNPNALIEFRTKILKPSFFLKFPVVLRVMAREILEVNTANGWHEKERSPGTGRALIHTEISEAFEASRSWGFDDKTPASPPYCIGCDLSGVGACDDAPHLPKPEGVGSEVADVLIRLLDEMDRQDVRLSIADLPVVTKNWTNFGDALDNLHRQVAMGNLQRTLATLGAIADMWKIDLHAEYRRKIAYNRTRGYRHGGKRV